MTEQEFRKQLHGALANVGLSSHNQRQVLAQMKGEEHEMKTRSKFRLGLVIAIALVIVATAAVAGETNAVNWKGQEQEIPPEMYLSDTESGARIEALANAYPDSEVTIIRAPAGGKYSNLSGSISLYASTVEEAKAWVGDSAYLPWPVQLPEGYTMTLGRVGYSCSLEGTHELLGKEETEDGYHIWHLTVPKEHRFAHDYMLRLENAQGDEVRIYVSMSYSSGQQRFRLREESDVTLLDVKGMDDALSIVSAEETMLAAHRQFSEAIRYHFPTILTWNSEVSGEVIAESVGSYDGIICEITATALDTQALLDIFGWETE
ncbi:MAG: hypothetical protein IJ438_06775 [Clostridia bacterium]|nr:hypothetical protein [Clostridia bacterium]